MVFVRSRRGGLVVVIAVVAVMAGSAISAIASPRGRVTPGHLDPTFGTQGKVVLSLSSQAGINDVAALGSGKLLATGFLGNDILLMRFKAGGHLDPTFGGGDGKVKTSFTGRASGGQSIAVVAGGKILVAGEVGKASDQSTSDVFLLRYNPGGGLDPTFGGGDGRVVTDVFGDADTFEALAVGGDGRVAMATESIQGGVLKPVLLRYTAIGNLDHTFSGDGKETLPTTGDPFIEAVTVQSNDKVVAAGAASNGANSDFVLYRVKAGGGLDATFGSGGTVFTDFDNDSDVADALRVDSSGRILAAGQATVGGDTTFALARYTKAGDPDTTFSGDGKTTTNVTTDFDRAFAMALESGKIVLGGRSDSASNDERWALARYKSNGVLDSGFGTSGKTLTNFSTDVSKEEHLNGLVLQPTTGRIVAGGTVGNRPALAGYVG
jgi:uncharacterized delta-60 repeat protein